METGKVKQKPEKLTKGKKKRIDILSSAMDILISDGYAELSMRSVARKLGMSLGNLQYHFPNKQVLVRELLSQYLDQAFQKIIDRASLEGNAGEAGFNIALDAAFSEQSKETCRIIYELWALSTRDKEVSEALKSFYEKYCFLVTTLLRSINPQLNEDSAARKAALLVAMLEGMSLFRLWDNSSLPPLSDLEDELKSIVEYAFLSCPST